MHLASVRGGGRRKRRSFNIISRAVQVFPYVRHIPCILLWQCTTRKNNFHSQRAGAAPSHGLPLHLTSGFVYVCALCFSLSLYLPLIICLGCLFTISPVFLHISFSFYFTQTSIVACQSINKQLAATPSPFELFASFWHWHCHVSAFLSPPAVSSMRISIYPNVITRFNMSAWRRSRACLLFSIFFSEWQCSISGAGLGRECVHHVAASSHGYGFFLLLYRYLHISIMRVSTGSIETA